MNGERDGQNLVTCDCECFACHSDAERQWSEESDPVPDKKTDPSSLHFSGWQKGQRQDP